MLVGAAIGDAAGSVARYVDHREAHGDGRVLAAALAPGLCQVALQQANVGYFVAHALAGLFRQLLAEVAQHLGRCRGAESIQVVAAPGGLGITQNLLEGLVVLGADLDWRRRRRGPAAATHCRRRCRTCEHVWAAGECRPGSAAEHPDQPPDDYDDQHDLKQEAKEATEAHHAAEEAMAKQQPTDACAYQPTEQAGHEAGARTEAGAICARSVAG